MEDIIMEKCKEVEYEVSMNSNASELLRRKTVMYKKLVVPVRMRSVYWKYFGFPAGVDGRILTKEKIVCVLCKTQMIYNRNTSNLRMHLVSKHKSTIQKIEPDINTTIQSYKTKKQQRAKNQPDTQVNGGGDEAGSKKGVDSRNVQVVVQNVCGDSDISNIAIIFPNEEMNGAEVKPAESSEVTDAVLNFFITDLVPPHVIEGEGFLKLLTHLIGRKIHLPSERKLICENLPIIHNTCREQLFSTITSNCITNMALSIEEWRGADNVKCLSIYMHYLQNGEPCLFTKLLTSVYCTGTETVSYWESTLNKLCLEWSINLNAVTAVLVSFSDPHLDTALKNSGLVLLPCFIFLIQELISKHCFSDPQVSTILSKCRTLVKVIHDMKIQVNEDTCQSIEEDDNDYPIGFDQPDLWLTTYYMLRSVFRRKDNITQFILGLQYVSSDAIFNSTQWQSIYDILLLLEPLKTITVTLLEEKNALISLLKPLIWQVNTSKFDINNSDTDLIQSLKHTIKNKMNEAYAEENIDNLTQIATTLDPRFKSFVQQDDTYNSECSLTDLLTHLVQSEGSLSPSSFPSPEKHTSSMKKANRSSINAIFGNFCVNKPELSVEDKVKIEVSHYQNETNALLEECPLEWWQHMRNKCPNLSRLALKYHCVPAIVTWYSGNRTLKDYTSFHQKRSLFNTNAVDSILFLHSNKFSF